MASSWFVFSTNIVLILQWLWIYGGEWIWRESVTSYSSFCRPCRRYTMKGYSMNIRPVPVSLPMCSTNYCLSCQESNRVLLVSLSQSLHFIHLYLHVALSKMKNVRKLGTFQKSKTFFRNSRVGNRNIFWLIESTCMTPCEILRHTTSLQVGA